jgi:pimeloyl-ACP methyl ester carboxylesterase
MFTHQRGMLLLTSALLLDTTACSDSSEPGADSPAVATASPAVQEVAASNPECSPDNFAHLPDVVIASVETESAPAPHCRVTGTIGTETNFELLLPDDWNGKFVMGGGGGFVGSVVNTALGYGVLQKGFATVGTDTGHRGSAIDASWALNNLERVVSFGHQAVHRTAVTAKALISDYYGGNIDRSLFFGCSRGGGQALMEAQRYPGDFDGIVAGAPAYSWTGELGGRNTLVNQAMYPDPANLSVATITPEALELMGKAVMQQCDALDGLEDGILNDPPACEFNFATLACSDSETEGCLTAQQLRAVELVYAGLTIDGEQIVPGYPLGAKLGEGGWLRWIAGGLSVLQLDEFQRGVEPDPEFPDPETPSAHFAFGNGVMKYLIFNDPDWDYSTYDFSTFKSDVAAAAQTLDATDPDLDAFRERGGKLLLFNGWRDMALTPLGTIKYYEQVVERAPDAAEDVRLVLLPGMDHCFGGPGPSFVNWVDEIDRWLETGQAPDQVEAYWVNESMQPEGSRPACAYPARLQYDGAGDPRTATSFRCEP